MNYATQESRSKTHCILKFLVSLKHKSFKKTFSIE